MSPIGQFEMVFLKFIKFQSHLKKNVLMVIHSSREWLGIQWVKLTLYFYQREKIAKRLYHGLLDTILVNTLTDVREFKNVSHNTEILTWWLMGAVIFCQSSEGGGESMQISSNTNY